MNEQQNVMIDFRDAVERKAVGDMFTLLQLLPEWETYGTAGQRRKLGSDIARALATDPTYDVVRADGFGKSRANLFVKVAPVEVAA